RRASWLDRPPRTCAVGRHTCPARRPEDWRTAARASAPGTRPPQNPRRGSTVADTDDDRGTVASCPRRRPPRRRRMRAHPPPRRRAWRPKDPRRALAGQEARCTHGRPRREDGAGPRRAQLPLHAPLDRASPSGTADAAPDRSTHSTAVAVPRPCPTQNRRPHMNLVEIDHALRKLRLSGMADVLETRLRHAQTERLAPIDLISTLVSDELLRRQDRLFGRRIKAARFRDADRSLDSFDFDFNKKMNRALIHELATARFVAQREDLLLLGPPGTGKSHLAQAIGRAAIQQGHRVVYRE